MTREDMSFIEAVRARPGMYFGGPPDDLLHLLWEVVGNSVDQHLSGALTKIDVTVHDDGSVSVADDGPGISITPDERGVSFLERALTAMHDTPTADGHAPHVHLGRRGVGLAGVCAVCSRVEVEVRVDAGHYRQVFARGHRVTALVRVGDVDGSGTTVRLTPDPAIFSARSWDLTRIEERLRELAWLCPGLATSFAVERRSTGPTVDLGAFVDHLAVGRRLHGDVILCAAAEGPLRARVGLRWCEPPRWGTPGRVVTYSNLAATAEGGTHLDGFARGLVGAFARVEGGESLGAAWRRPYELLAHGLFAVVAVDVLDPTFHGPTRERLTSPEAGKIVRRALMDDLPRALGPLSELRAILGARLSVGDRR